MKTGKRGRFRESLNYLKESKNYFLIIIILFIISSLIGYLFPIFFREQIFRFLIELTEQTQDYNFIQMFFFILQNNIKSSFMVLIFGPLAGVFPIFSTIANGYLIGFVGNLSTQIAGPISLLRLLPHGIFELPAIIISLSLGLKLGIQLLTIKSGKRKKEKFLHNLNNSLWIFIYIVLPLLLIAGLIETLLIIMG